MARLVAAGVTLRAQVDERWPDRDRASDGWIGDAAHQARPSDHNADAAGWVHALDIDKDGINADALADELVALARARKDGGRLKNIVWRGRVASGTYADRFWVWRSDPSLGHFHHIHVSFTAAARSNGAPFLIDCLEDPLMALSDADVQRIADAVWNRPIRTAYQPDGSVDPDKRVELRAAALLADARGIARRVAFQGAPTADRSEVADAVVDEIAERIGE